MNNTLQSYSIVPSDLYVERDADQQIRSVVNGMARPGYVQVARQMGKTNLLLHTKRTMENSQHIFAYVDLSCMHFSNESEFYDEIIDVIIDSCLDLFDEEFRFIENRRNSRESTTQREFTRDLRLLLRKVHKLVIILDEIESLLNHTFSDNVFSLIRSHYFQRSSYQDLSKLSYLLAGVTEPKNIIKNRDISPFNTCQLILVKDFTKEEYLTFLEKTSLVNLFPKEVRERIYYWTQGQPRMTWDLCQVVSEYAPCSTDDVDNIVDSFYLTTCDKAPIDNIRKILSGDIELRDATVQLLYSKGQGISADTKSKLLLSGITTNEATSIRFKNPIIEKSLPENWLLSIDYGESSIKHSIDKANRLIFIDNDYNGAMLILNTLNTGNRSKFADEINYLLGVVYYRQYLVDEAMVQLLKVTTTASSYIKSRIVLSKCYLSLNEYDKAINLADECLRIINDKDTEYRFIICKAQCYIEKGDESSWAKAEKLLGTIISNKDNIHYVLLACYQAARLYRKMNKKGLAIGLIDSALSFAQKDEIPVLLYEKYRLAETDDQGLLFMQELVNEVINYYKKPILENFDNELVFSQYFAYIIFAEIILKYPQYTETISPCLKWFFERKEDLYSSICATLEESNNPLAKSFAKHIITISSLQDYSFRKFQISAAYATLSRCTDDKCELSSIGLDFYNFLSKADKSDLNVDPSLIRPLISQLESAVKAGEYKHVKKVVTLASIWFNKLPKNKRDEEYFLLTSYYTALIAYIEKNYQMFIGSACMYLSRVKNYIDSLTEADVIDIPIDKLLDNKNELYTYGKYFNDIKTSLGISIMKTPTSVNYKVKVYDHIKKTEYIAKYKTVKKEVESGFVEIIEFPLPKTANS